jgi:hypothetical protein
MSGTGNYGIQIFQDGELTATSVAAGPHARAEVTIRPAARAAGPELALLVKDLRVALLTAESEPADSAAAPSLADASAIAATLAAEVKHPDVHDSRLRELLQGVSASAGCVTAVALAITALRTALNLA